MPLEYINVIFIVPVESRFFFRVLGRTLEAAASFSLVLARSATATSHHHIGL